MSRKNLLIGLLLTGGVILLLFYFFNEQREKVRAEKIREAQIKEASTKSSDSGEGNRAGKGLKLDEKERESYKIIPIDKRILTNITKRWKERVKAYLVEIINDGNRKGDDLLTTIAIGSTPAFRGEFIKIMNSPYKELKFVSAVGLLNADDSSGLIDLENALKNGTWQAKLLAAKTLAVNGDERGLPVVREICGHPDWGARIEAVRTLGYFQSGATKDELLNYLNDSDEHIRTSSAGALAMLGEEQGVNYLKKNLTHYDPAIQIYSAEVLARVKNRAPMNIFLSEIASRDPYERIHGAIYLMVLGDGRGVDIVNDALNNPYENTGSYALALLSENLRYIQ